MVPASPRDEAVDVADRLFRGPGVRGADLPPSEVRVVRGAMLLLGARFATTLSMLVATAILARFLGPAAFGSVAMVTSVFALARALEEFGLGDAMIQSESVSEEQVSSLFWLNAASGLLLTLGFLAAAPLIGRFFQRPEIAALTLALAPVFALSSLGGQHRALMRRQGHFRKLATVQVGSAVTGASVGCVAAAAGLGIWSLVAQSLSAAGALLVGSWLGSGWRPSRPRVAKGLRPLLAFGMPLAASQMLTALSQNLDNLLIGRFVGGPALGFYDRAFQLMSIPSTQLNQPLSAAVVPALSRLQHDSLAYRHFYVTAAGAVALIGLPVAVFTAVAAHAIVGVVLGDGWAESAVLLQALSPVCLLLALNGTTVWVYQSLGRTHRQLLWTLIGLAGSAVGIVSGLPWGALGVALGLSVARVLLRGPAIVHCFRGTPLRPSDLVLAAWQPAVASLVAGSAALWVDPAGTPAIVRLGVQLAVFVPVLLLALMALPGGWQRLASVRTPIALLGAERYLRAALRLGSSLEKPLQQRGLLPTRHLRLPDFLGIGAQKAGTTWLAANLGRHPGIFLPTDKELHYFDGGYHRGLSYYSSHFTEAGQRVAGEITPAYAILPEDRVRFLTAVMPGVRVIFIMRDPIERAWSGAIRERVTLQQRSPASITVDEWIATVRSASVQCRSRYTESLDRWGRFVPAERTLLAFYDDIVARPAELLSRVHAFLGCAPIQGDEALARERLHVSPPAAMPEAVREELVVLLGGEIRALAERLGGPALDWARRWRV